MQPPTRALPPEDLAALLGVVAVVEGHLVSGDLPTDLTHDLIRRLTEHGPLPAGSTPGTLNAALSGLAQRLHWASSTDMDYPAANPHRTTYHLIIPSGAVAACVAELREVGADDIHHGPPTTTGWEMRPSALDGNLERHPTDVPNGRTVTAAFPELAPDPAYHERITQLNTLAERHGGRYDGASW